MNTQSSLQSHILSSIHPREVDLNLWEKAPKGPEASDNRQVLFLHGYGLPTGRAFDVPGASWMQHFAEQGIRSWALDFTGFGNSRLSGKSEFDFSLIHTPVLASEATHDVDRALNYIRCEYPEVTIDLIAWSWGGVVAGSFLAGNDKNYIKSLTLVGSMHSFELPEMANRFSNPDAPDLFNESIQAEQIVTANALLDQWNGMLEKLSIPADVTVSSVIQSEAVDIFLESDWKAKKTGEVRRPTGPLRDLFNIWRGVPVYNASCIDIPTLIVRGANDPYADAKLSKKIPNSNEVVIENATHYLYLEEVRGQLYAAFDEFRKAISSNGVSLLPNKFPSKSISLNKDNRVINLQTAEQCREFGKVVAQHWLDRKPLPVLDPSLSMDNAIIIRDVFLNQIEAVVGKPAGYKVAAITPPAQRDLGIYEPLGAIYLSGMFKPALGATVSASYGARPIVEAKLMAVVGDEAINEAENLEDIANSIMYLNPSIELGDSLAHQNQTITGAVLTVYDVGARCVLTGPLIPFRGTKSDIKKLEEMVVTTVDTDTGHEIDRHGAEVMMGSPLNAMLWIVKNQRSRGIRLRQGNLLGLGAMSRVRPRHGQSINTIWEGLLPEPIEVGVKFS